WSQIPFEHQQAALRGKCRGPYVHPECVWWLARRKGRGELLVVFVEGERIALHCDGWVGLRVLLQQRVHRRLQGWVCGHPEPKGDGATSSNIIEPFSRWWGEGFESLRFIPLRAVLEGGVP